MFLHIREPGTQVVEAFFLSLSPEVFAPPMSLSSLSRSAFRASSPCLTTVSVYLRGQAACVTFAMLSFQFNQSLEMSFRKQKSPYVWPRASPPLLLPLGTWFLESAVLPHLNRLPPDFFPWCHGGSLTSLQLPTPFK